MVQYAVLPTSSPGCETTLGTRVRFASYLLQSLENKFNKTDRLSPYSQNSSYYHWRKYKSLITLEPTSILLECVPVAPNSYRQRSLHLLDNLKIQFFTFIKTSNKYSKILVFKCSVNVLFSFIINYIFHYIHTYIYIYVYIHILTTLKESLRAAKRLIENVMKTFPSNSVRVGPEKRKNKL